MKTTSSTTNLIACAVIVSAITAGFATGPAFGQTAARNTEPFAFSFTYSPDELTNADSAKRLLVRLESSVRSYCRGYDKISVTERDRIQACIDDTMRQSVSKFGSTTLAQAYSNRADG